MEISSFLLGNFRLLSRLKSKYLCLVDERGGEENEFEVFEAVFLALAQNVRVWN